VEHRRLGRSGLKISEITLGNWLTHGSQIDETAATACVRTALDLGITTFDTADIYAATAAEEVLGRALRGQRREGVEIFTKCYWPVGPGANDRGLSRKHIVEACHASLRRLQTDYVDLYQAHRFDYEAPLEETLRAFEDLVRQGKALYIGVSEWTAEQIAEAVEIADAMGFDRIISNQPQYSMLWRVIEERVIPTCDEHGIGQIVWSPLAQGVLTGKYEPGKAPPEGSRAADAKVGMFVRGFMTDDILTAVAGLKPIAAECGLTMAQFAVAWVLQNPSVSAALIGASRPDQVTDNAAASGVRLEPEVLEHVDKVLVDVIERDPSKTSSPKTRP